MPSGQLVAASFNLANATTEQRNDSRRSFVASNGRRIAILENTTGGLQYATSSDGVTWTTPATLYTGASANRYGTLAYGTQAADTLYVWYSNGTSTLFCAVLAYTAASNTFGAATVASFPTGSSPAFNAPVIATWDTVKSVWYVCLSQGDFAVAPFTISGTTMSRPSLGVEIEPVATGTPWAVRCVGGATSAITVLYTGSNGTTLLVRPATYNGTTMAVGTVETVASLVPKFAACELDNSNLLDIVYIDTAYKVQTVKRTGTNTYSLVQNIASGSNSTLPTLSLTPDGSGGLYVLYASVAGQTNAEIYSIQRQGASWQQPALFAGGDTGGYSIPRSTTLPTSNRVDVLYDTGTASPFSVYYKSLFNASAPNAPINVTPVAASNIGTLTPSFAWTYGNPVAGDLQSAYEIKVIRVSDSVVMWDSGQVTSTASSGITYAGTALSYAVQYQWQVRTWDTNLTPTQPSAYSTATTFTPFHSPTGSITAVISNGTTFSTTPVTLPSPTFDVTFSYSEADGNAGNFYQITVFQADGTTQVWQGPKTALSPTLASGNSFTTPDQVTTGLNNSSTYLLQVTVWDSVTGIAANSAQWTLTTSWAPPGNPSGLSATANNDNGRIDLAWTPGASTASVNIYRRPTGTTSFTLLSSGTLRTTLSDFAPVNVAFDYGVQGVGATGATTPIITVSNTTLGLKYNAFGVWLNDVTDPANTSVALGAVDQSWSDATAWTHIEDVLRYVPVGSGKPIASYGLADYWEARPRKYFVPAVMQALSGGGSTTGLATIALLTTMVQTHRVLLYRDPIGNTRSVVLENFTWEVNEATNYDIGIDLSEIRYTGSPLVL